MYLFIYLFSQKNLTFISDYYEGKGYFRITVKEEGGEESANLVQKTVLSSLSFLSWTKRGKESGGVYCAYTHLYSSLRIHN